MEKALQDFSENAYGETAALRYNIFESKSDGFAMKMAPKINAFYQKTSLYKSNKKVLDVACGTGQLATYFLARGYHVTGLDLASHMVNHATANNAKYVENKQALFTATDASNFDLDPQFGLVVSTFNGMNHLQDFEAVEQSIANICKALVPGGYFVFDINTQLGLKRVIENTSVIDTEDEITLRKRFFNGNRVTLYASGCFKHNNIWHRYQETIYKIKIETKRLQESMLSNGWSSFAFTAEDLTTPVQDPENNEVAYIIAKK